MTGPTKVLGEAACELSRAATGNGADQPVPGDRALGSDKTKLLLLECGLRPVC
jgi:hypothetical protein